MGGKAELVQFRSMFCSSRCIPSILSSVGFLLFVRLLVKNYDLPSLLFEKAKKFEFYILSEFTPLMSGKFHLRS